MSNKIEQKYLIPLTVLYSRSTRVHAIVFQKLGKILKNFKLAGERNETIEYKKRISILSGNRV